MTVTSPETIFGRYFLSEYQPWIMIWSLEISSDRSALSRPNTGGV